MPAPNMIQVQSLARLIGTSDCPRLIDVCIDADFTEDPRLIPTSTRVAHTAIADTAPDLFGARVVVICQKGKKLSQGAAALLRSHGVAAEALEGGVYAWRDAGLPLIPAERLPRRGQLWVTRHRPKVDRIACPWLIRRFIDPEARFLFVEPAAVLDVAEKFDAISFDTAGAEFSHSTDAPGTGTLGTQRCSFDALLAQFELQTEPLTRMADVIRAADGTPGASAAEAPGFLALSLGLSRMFKDDLEQLDAGLLLYDALYRWARDSQDETHQWDAHGGAQ